MNDFFQLQSSAFPHNPRHKSTATKSAGRILIKKGFSRQVLLSLLCWLLLNPAWSQTPSTKRILFLGDSLTAGYGLSKEEAYPQHIQSKLSTEGYHYTVVNAGISGDTSAGGLRRIDWLLRQNVDILVLALGANDGLRGVDPRDTLKNLKAIIEKTKAKFPNSLILIAGMKVPPNLGGAYATAFENVFTQLGEQDRVELIPFLLEKVAGKSDLNLGDRIHPNEDGHRIIANTVWTHLKPLLKKS